MLTPYTAGRVVGSNEYVLIMRDTEAGDLKSIPTNPGGTVVYDGVLYSAHGVKLADENTYRDLEFFGGFFETPDRSYGTYLATEVNRNRQTFVRVDHDSCAYYAIWSWEEKDGFGFEYLDREFFKGTFMEKFCGREYYLAVGPQKEHSYIVCRAVSPIVEFIKIPIDESGQNNERIKRIIGLPKFSKDHKVLQFEAKISAWGKTGVKRYGTDEEFLEKLRHLYGKNYFSYFSGFPCYPLD